MHAQEQKRFLAILCGEHRLNGVRNRDMARAWNEPVRGPADRLRDMQRVSRLLQLLRAHGLIEKVPHCHRYQITANGDKARR